MKPLGMTANFQIMQPHPAQDAIYDAVVLAVEHNMTPEMFLAEVRVCWGLVMDDHRKYVMGVLR